MCVCARLRLSGYTISVYSSFRPVLSISFAVYLTFIYYLFVWLENASGKKSKSSWFVTNFIKILICLVEFYPHFVCVCVLSCVWAQEDCRVVVGFLCNFRAVPWTWPAVWNVSVCARPNSVLPRRIYIFLCVHTYISLKVYCLFVGAFANIHSIPAVPFFLQFFSRPLFFAE